MRGRSCRFLKGRVVARVVVDGRESEQARPESHHTFALVPMSSPTTTLNASKLDSLYISTHKQKDRFARYILPLFCCIYFDSSKKEEKQKGISKVFAPSSRGVLFTHSHNKLLYIIQLSMSENDKFHCLSKLICKGHTISR